MMTHKECFYATIERKDVDKPASWLGIPTPETAKNLTNYFQVDSLYKVTQILDDDLYPVELPYHSPTSDAIYMAFDFAQQGQSTDENRTLTAPGFFEHYSDPSRIEEFGWPDPTKYIDPDECRQVVESAPQDRAILGVLWSCHFQDACAAFGMETALVKMLNEPDMFQAIIDRITTFYLQANEIFYEATQGKLDAILIGNDFGGQRGLILSPKLIRKHVWSGTKQLIEQAKSYGVKVIHHSCGSIYPIIQDLIELSVDAIHPIQAMAKGMSAEKLKEDFYGKVSFCGGVDTQELLARGTPKQVYQRVQELKALFPTGLIISPSHEALLPDVEPKNVEAIFKAIKN